MNNKENRVKCKLIGYSLFFFIKAQAHYFIKANLVENIAAVFDTF